MSDAEQKLEEEFQKAADDVKNLKARPSDLELLETYALFKQATVGDCNQPKPGVFAMKEKAKHDYWTKKKGMSHDDAKKAYIALSKKMVATFGLKE